jgi:ATP-binding cassette subfamily B protein
MLRQVPEVVQTSAMDCGPAALAALLNGCGIDVSYPRLREACQTDVDGTSIDTLEDLAQRFGLDAEQVMLPDDFLLDPGNGHLPCIAVVTLPSGLTHFVVIWRVFLGWYEVMDPARGRAWVRRRELESILYEHELEVPAQDWLDYAGSEPFLGAIRRGLKALSIKPSTVDELMADAIQGGEWRSFATLDAALRMCRTLHRNGQGLRGRRAAQLLKLALRHPELVLDQYYQVVAADDSADTLRLRGAVVLQVNGELERAVESDPIIGKALGGFHLPVLQRLWQLLREIGFDHLGAQLAAVGLTMGLLTFVEALVFRYLLGFQPPTELGTFAVVAVAVILPSAAALVCDIGQTRFGAVLGRRLETELRAKLLRKLPRIRDDYFASRLVSDLAERAHAITQLREAPLISIALVVNLARISLILIGLAWLMSASAWIVALAGMFAIVAPLRMFRLLAERDFRARTHLGALANLYLDTLRGTEPVWAHGAGPALEQEHDTLLLRWVRAATRLRRAATVFETIQVTVLGACGVALVLQAIERELPQGSVLLIAYWSLFVPMLSRGLLNNLKQLPPMYNIVRRVVEVLDAPEEPVEDRVVPLASEQSGIKLELQHVRIERGAREVLSDLNVTIDAGERVAIVGVSGSGKSSFLGAIAGWHRVAGGRLLIDGMQADSARIRALRQCSALVDPETYLFNRDIYASVVYGVPPAATAEIDGALDASELVIDLETMADGLATRIGENGSRLSGGEAQRLRIARALIRADARIVLLDEPFAGMDAEQRERMRLRVLDRWPAATLLWVSHHVRETVSFPRVLVFDGGRIVEDEAPDALLSRPSRYAAMIDAELSLERRMRASPWRVVSLDDASTVAQP